MKDEAFWAQRNLEVEKENNIKYVEGIMHSNYHRYINDLVDRSAEIAKSKGWEEEKRSFGDLISLMHSELSEALECYREGKHFKEVWFQQNGKPEGIAIELADCIIRIFHFCKNKDIDIEYYINLKLAYNSVRPHRHGGKKI